MWEDRKHSHPGQVHPENSRTNKIAQGSANLHTVHAALWPQRVSSWVLRMGPSIRLGISHPSTKQEATAMLRFCKISFTKNWGSGGEQGRVLLKRCLKTRIQGPQSKKTRVQTLNLRTEGQTQFCRAKNQCSVSGSNCYLSESCHTRY